MDGRLSSIKVFFLSLSFSCGMAVVLMQGNMHWRWAQGPPTRPVCLYLLPEGSLSLSLFCFVLFYTGHWQSHSIHLLLFSKLLTLFYSFIIIPSNIKANSAGLFLHPLSSSHSSSVITSVLISPWPWDSDPKLYWPWPPCFPPLKYP